MDDIRVCWRSPFTAIPSPTADASEQLHELAPHRVWLTKTILPPVVAEVARERGRARDLEAAVKELLAELEGETPLSDRDKTASAPRFATD